MSETVATKAAAEHVGTTPRQLRQFLRASKDYEAVGSGGRYAFTEDDLPELKTRYQAWATEREAAAKARAEKEAAEATPAQATDTEGDTDEPAKDEPKPATKTTRSRKPTAA